MTLLLCIRRLAHREGIYWVVPDLESAVGGQEGGHCGDGIHHKYAHTPGAEHLAPQASINIVVTLSQWITAVTVRVDAAIRADLTLMLHHPYTSLSWPRPMCRLGYTSTRRFPLGCNMSTGGEQTMTHQQRQVVPHRMRHLPTAPNTAMCSGAHVASSMEVAWRRPTPLQHLWECPVQSHEW